ncbi:MAG: site-specific integrase [Rubrivivax sp.]|nr:site-specific integrase [Burkholderiales bacterium]MCW5632046.1 site-specific integrase [Rubrivivax sp.]
MTSPACSRADDAEAMLREVLAGDTYDVVASRHGITRTGVERRIKSLAARAAASVSIAGLNVDGVSFVRRLRANREAVLAALASLGVDNDAPAIAPCRIRILSEDEIAVGATRLRTRSLHAQEDLALYYLMLATGARPLEIARLRVFDYLAPDGSVRTASELRADVAITGRSRPLHFRSGRLNAAIGEYLAGRVHLKHGIGPDGQYRGLDPLSRLFLSPTGKGFEILAYGAEGQRRFRCRAIQETYRAIWRNAGFRSLTTLAVRHTVADRLYARGADEMQVGVLLGISERAAVREMFPRRLPSLDELTDELV